MFGKYNGFFSKARVSACMYYTTIQCLARAQAGNHNIGLLWFYKEHFKTFCEAFVVEFYLKLMLILRIITYLTYICREIDNFVIKSDIFRRFFLKVFLKVFLILLFLKNILKKLSCYHDNNFGYFMFGKTMVLSARRGFLHACIF